MYYQLYEFHHAAIQPARAYADAIRLFYSNPFNPAASTAWGRSIAATAEMFERTTRRYAKPKFGIEETTVDGRQVGVHEHVVWQKPFCRLIRFERDLPAGSNPGPKLLVVAPMSGHYATLLRGTVEAMLPNADVYITDWTDARMVPLSDGRFDLDDYIDYIIDMFAVLGPQASVMAVCQPSVPVLAAIALMEGRGDRNLPASMILMGGPIDTRRNPTAVNELAEERGIDWFRENVIMQVPWPNPGFMREVYPGFLQLSGFMSMNLDRHIIAHKEFFMHLVENDGDSAEKHRDFYDEYLAVMDLTAEFYLQTVDTVFVKHALPKGEMMHRNERVEPAAISRVALLTIEGEKDDISGLGQTEAAHDLCVNIPQSRRSHYVQPSVGHYGVFNGSRFRAQIVPRIVEFISASTTAGANQRKTPARPRRAKSR
ncbi:polyhydroxyalkanoate depolymerase [Nitratireductor luteus]|uniref:polyhydroxyalkanoate depolymerase n=1 Tax=Nitratireductor luteus TaxID=2976980 RepID=UPI00223EEE8C|nr:polyhydroxyalkanoate depolymerase [Nitratireductor luteus]